VTFNANHCIPWKDYMPKPARRKPPRPSAWEMLRTIHRASTGWRWPTWGALHLRTLADAEHFRSRWLYGTREDPSSFIEELPTEAAYHDTYRALIARWEAQDPNDVEMQSPTAGLHIAAMKRILADAEAP
jgi:hypothetical protein